MIRAVTALALITASPAVTHILGLYTGLTALTAGWALAVWSRK